MKIDLTYTPSLKNEEVFARLQADNALLPLPLVAPAYLDDLAVTRPLYAMHECAQGLGLLNMGSQLILRSYISSTYKMAFYLKKDPAAINRFAEEYYSWGLSKKRDVEKTRSQLLERVFYFVFRDSGIKKNSLYRYAYGLQNRFDANVAPDTVREQVIAIGTEKLYNEAVERNKLIKSREIYELTGRDINDPIDDKYISEATSSKSDSNEMMNTTGLIDQNGGIAKGSESVDASDELTGTGTGFNGPAQYNPHPRELPDMTEEIEDSLDDAKSDYEDLFEMVQELQQKLKIVNDRVSVLETSMKAKKP